MARSLEELGLRQDELKLRGAALQCRITTEDPAADSGPTPARSRPTVRRAAPASVSMVERFLQVRRFQPALRLDAREDDLPWPRLRGGRAPRTRGLAEFRIRGVSTNIPFLQAVLDDPEFIAGDVSTAFIDERPWLVNSHRSKDRGTKILNWLADVTVNQPNGDGAGIIKPAAEAARGRPHG